MLKDRIFWARGCLERLSLDALLVTSLPSLRYFTGFTGSDGVLLLTKENGCFLTDSRYTTQATEEISGIPVEGYRTKMEAVASWLQQAGCRQLGFEASDVTYAVYRELSEKLSEAELVPLKDDLALYRRIKCREEVNLIENAASIASAALVDILQFVRHGVVERDIALELEMAMKRRGADDKAFDFIVASGPRGALPHGRASERIINSGEMVTIDFGAVCSGYHSDETVTLAVGEPNDELRSIYAIVKEAHDRSLDAIRPGIALKEIDGIARSFIEDKGYGNFFGHGLGHGVGLEVHEKPLVSYRSEEIAEEGMVFTVEPGIYLPGLGGVRIEDTIAVESDGCRLLTNFPKELKVL